MNSTKITQTKNFYEEYVSFKELDYNDFKLSPEGLSNEQHKKALETLNEYMSDQKKYFLGYQVNNNINYSKDLKQYLDMHINNVGDPFTPGNLTMNSKFMERAVLDYYANLWHGVCPHDKNNGESYWGYTLSMGSTEGNVYAIWNARDYLSGKILLINTEGEEVAKAASKDGRPARVPEEFTYHQSKATEDNPNAYTPIAFYSQDTHYSLVKAMRVLNFQTFYSIGSENYECPLKYPEDYPEGFSINYLGKNNWPLEVPSNFDGSIHIPSLTKLAEFFISKGYPIFACFNYGSTFKGAYDNIPNAVNALVPILKKYNMYEREISYEQDGVVKKSIRNGFWFHVDGALGAAYMPFIEMAYNESKISLPKNYKFPIFDFRIPEIHSIVMSGHKWIGAPFPCGIFMTKTKYQLLPPDDPMYIGSPDTTFAGSRNGLVPMILWDYVAKHSYSVQVEKAVKTEMMIQYAVNKLKELESNLQQDLWVERTPLSITVRFKRPNENIIFKYSLSCESLYVNGKKRSYSHIFAMDHVTKELIDNLVSDLSKPGAFLEQPSNISEHKSPVLESESVYTQLFGRGFK